MEEQPNTPIQPVPDIPSQPIVPQSNPMPTQPAQPPTPTVSPSFLKKFARIILILIVTVAVGGVAFVVWYFGSIFAGLHGDLSACSKGRTQLFSNTQTITDQFNNLALIPDHPEIKAQVTKQEGDCVDSLPTIFATKTYTVTATAGAAYDQMTNTLTKSGYKAEDDRYATTLNPCSYKDKRYRYTNADHKIDITLTCASDSIKGQDWRQIPATKAVAYLEVAWAYPKK